MEEKTREKTSKDQRKRATTHVGKGELEGVHQEKQGSDGLHPRVGRSRIIGGAWEEEETSSSFSHQRKREREDELIRNEEKG